MCLAVFTLRCWITLQPQIRLSTSDWSLYYGVQIETKLRRPAAAGVSSKMNGKWCVFAAAPDLTAGFLIANGHSGLFAELFVLVKANKQMI